ncbi:MAG: superoxide dismutase, partial [Polymorphobacter sp.]
MPIGNKGTALPGHGFTCNPVAFPAAGPESPMPAYPPLTPARIGATPQILLPLPFDLSAFEPVISAESFSLHHGRHHKGYIDTLQKLVSESSMADRTLEEIIFATAGKAVQAPIFQNAAQSWNHAFYWQSLSPEQRSPSGMLATVIDRDFGSLTALKAALVKAASGRFGSGWVWLGSGLITRTGRLRRERRR